MTTEELEQFANENFPESMQVKINPFKIFFNMLILFLKGNIPPNMNNLLHALFGTSDITNKTIKDLVGDQNFLGATLVDYIKSNDNVETFSTEQALLDKPRKEYEFIRLLSTSTTTQLYAYNVNRSLFVSIMDLDNYYTKSEVDNKISKVYKIKGSVNDYASLPTSGMTEGDVYNIIDTGDNYVWVLNLNNTNNPGWDKLSGMVDLSNYATIQSVTDLNNANTLQTVTTRGNSTERPLILKALAGRAGEINFDSTTYSYHFGNMNVSQTGIYNSSFGYDSLPKLTTGTENATFGSYTGPQLTTGNENTYIGTYSGENANTGNYNTGVGGESLNKLTSGYKNTGIGMSSLFNITTSNYNTALGYASGLAAAGVGDRNIFIGPFSGQSMTGQNNILIGIGAGIQNVISNKLIIHNNHTLTGYNNTSDGNFGSFQQGQLNRALITGDFLDRWVRFNAGYFQIGNPGDNASDITINPSTGITSTIQYTPQTNKDYIQRGWVFQNYYNMTQIDSMISRTYRPMGSKDNYDDLLNITDQKVGDVWNLLDTGDNYVWIDDIDGNNTSGWDKLSGMVDLSNYIEQNFQSVDVRPNGAVIHKSPGEFNQYELALNFNDDEGFIFSSESPSFFSYFSITPNKFGINVTNKSTNYTCDATFNFGRGLGSNNDYSADVEDFDYIQKIYVDNNFLKTTGSENQQYRNSEFQFYKGTGAGGGIGQVKLSTMTTSDHLDFPDYSVEFKMNVEEGIELMKSQGVNNIYSKLSITSYGMNLYIQSNPSTSNSYEFTSTGIFTEFYIAPEFDTHFVQKKYVDDKKPYKSYVCLLRAGGTPTPSPTFVELENSIGSIVWTRTNVGEYTGTLNGAFVQDKTVIFQTNEQGNGGSGYPLITIAGRTSANTIFVKVTRADGTPYEFSGQLGSLEVRVYK